MKTRKSAPISRREERVLEGIPASGGIAIGPLHVREAGEIRVAEYLVPAQRVETEVERFRAAVAKALRQLEKLRRKATAIHGASGEELGYLLEAHLHMLGSGRLKAGVESRIAERRSNAEWAVSAEIAAIAGAFAEMDDPYLASRGEEIRQVGYRILRNLAAEDFKSFEQLPAGSVIASEEITPADTALMDPRQVAGFASVLGGAEGHTAIMARSLGLPAVLGVSGLLAGAEPGSLAILDGDAGLVILDPTPERLRHYRRLRQRQRAQARSLTGLAGLKAQTRDGRLLSLQANLELPSEAAPAAEAGAEAVGLLRTEFLFMNRQDLPDEEEQTAALAAIVKAMGGRPVTARTLDVGGEKLASSLGGYLGEATNPALGLRAIRLSLKVPELLETQLAAMLRAGALGPIRILLPMVSSASEVKAVRRHLARVARRLRRRGVPIADPLPPLGVMIEVPGAALAADSLVAESDFFAIGTNDLIMYTLAIDRGEEQVAHLYDPLHPSVLRLIHFAVDVALTAGKPVSVCGEMAGDPRFVPLFVGLGVKELSMRSKALAPVKDRIRHLEARAAEALVAKLVAQRDREAIAELLDKFNEGL